MSKRQKLSFIYFEDLPDEILLNIFSFLDIKGVLQCGQVSKRLRAISNDQCLWSKLNLFGMEVPYGIIEKAIQNGCEYLNLGFSCIYGGKKSEVPWKLKYLEISQSHDLEWTPEVPKGVIENCQFLQKLAVDNFKLDSNKIDQICQNGETLQILSLEGCYIDFYQRSEWIEKLFTKCPQLTELNIRRSIGVLLLDSHACAFVESLTPDILKLNLASQECITDEHVDTLVRRCNKITELDLSFTKITNDSVESIMKHLNCLEKLNVGYTKIDFSTLLQLKSIPTLKSLHFGRFIQSKGENTEAIKKIKLQLPHIRINEGYTNIADPTKFVNGSVDLDWFWEIRAKKQDLFRETIGFKLGVRPYFLEMENLVKKEDKFALY